MIKKILNKNRRAIRVRAKIAQTAQRLRLSVFRSNKHMYAQIIDDAKGITVASVSSQKSKNTKKVELSKELGKLLAEKALKKNIKTIVFDRGSYKYHGRVKALAEGAREGGLKF